MSNQYYISTGAKNCFYTLRYTFTEEGRTHVGDGNFETFTITRDYHVCNLSTDRTEAIAKAKARTSQDLSASFDVNPIYRQAEIDWSILQAGKYAGQSIHEIAEQDKDYLVWLCENCATSSRYTKTVELAKALVQHELDARATDRNDKAAAEADRKAKAITILAPLADRIADGRNGFCDSIAQSIRNGEIPTGRGLNITLEILAKQAGRRNSKAYEAEYVKLEQLFEKVA